MVKISDNCEKPPPVQAYLEIDSRFAQVLPCMVNTLELFSLLFLCLEFLPSFFQRMWESSLGFEKTPFRPWRSYYLELIWTLFFR